MDIYYFKFRSGYGVRVERDNFPDAVILAKAQAIIAGNSQPKIDNVKVNDSSILYFCSVCGTEIVNPKNGEDTCQKCLFR